MKRFSTSMTSASFLHIGATYGVSRSVCIFTAQVSALRSHVAQRALANNAISSQDLDMLNKGNRPGVDIYREAVDHGIYENELCWFVQRMSLML